MKKLILSIFAVVVYYGAFAQHGWGRHQGCGSYQYAPRVVVVAPPPVYNTCSPRPRWHRRPAVNVIIAANLGTTYSTPPCNNNNVGYTPNTVKEWIDGHYENTPNGRIWVDGHYITREINY